MEFGIEMGAQVLCGTGRDVKKEKEANTVNPRERRHQLCGGRQQLSVGLSCW